NFVQRLAAKVFCAQQVSFSFLHEFADVAEVRALQTVGRTHRQIELLDRTQEVFVEGDGRNLSDLRRPFSGFGGAGYGHKDRQLTLQFAGRGSQRLFRTDTAVSPEL